MTNERLEMVANAVRDESTMVQWGIVVDSTSKWGYKKGSDEKLTTYFITQNPIHNMLIGNTFWTPPKLWRAVSFKQPKKHWSWLKTAGRQNENTLPSWKLDKIVPQATLQRLCYRNKSTLDSLVRLALRDKEDWCSVNWFVALHCLQQLAQLSLCLNFRRSLRFVRLRQWVRRRRILQRHRQRPLCLCRLLPVRLLRHLKADLVRLSRINSWRHCWVCSYAGSWRKQHWYNFCLYWPHIDKQDLEEVKHPDVSGDESSYAINKTANAPARPRAHARSSRCHFDQLFNRDWAWMSQRLSKLIAVDTCAHVY